MARTPFWTDVLIDQETGSAAADIVSLSQDLTNLQTRGVTIVRTIIDLHMAPTLPGAVTGIQKVSLGIGIASLEAFTSGVVLDANAASEKPPRGWLFRTQCMVIDMPEGVSIVKCVGDFRGKRKLDNGEPFIQIMNDPASGTSFTVTTVGIVRTLMLLD